MQALALLVLNNLSKVQARYTIRVEVLLVLATKILCIAFYMVGLFRAFGQIDFVQRVLRGRVEGFALLGRYTMVLCIKDGLQGEVGRG